MIRQLKYVIGVMLFGIAMSLSAADQGNYTNYTFKHTQGAYELGGYNGKYNQLGNYDHSFVTSADDPRLAAGVTLQRTYVYEHIVYAMPGEAITLRPYSDFEDITNYTDKYVRWFDYATDKQSPYISSNKRFELNANFGHVGGSYLGTRRNYMTVATFNAPSAANFNKDIYIACDISQIAPTVRNRVLTEPLIAVRHIFVIKNANQMAQDMSSSKEANEAYIAKTRRRVEARAGYDFNIHLDSDLPQQTSTATNYYYLNGTTVEHVPYYAIRTYKDGKLLNTSPFVIDNTTSGNYPYYRGIKCTAANAQEGTYIVQIVGRNRNNNADIKINGTNETLVLAEFEVQFVGKEKSTIYTADEEKTAGAEHTEAYLEKHYGTPIATINFDDYSHASADVLTQSNGHIYKWPLPWDDVQYMFYYDSGSAGDYHMYMLADHSSATPYHNAINYRYGDAGLYDRKYYNTNGEEKGYFFYLNAASDPSVIANIEVPDFCLGTTVYVSAWFAEFSRGTETANLILNFNAVMKDGSRTKLHSFSTGYVEGHGTQSTGISNLGDKGEWLHIYYSFVPGSWTENLDMSQVDHMELSLENNCMNSNGADYAVDDIRVYVQSPDVAVNQTTPLCGKELGFVKVGSEYSTLLSSIGIVEQTDKSKAAKHDCWFCFLDKQIFDAAPKTTKEEWQAALENALVGDLSADPKTMPDLYPYHNVQFYDNYDIHPEYNFADLFLVEDESLVMDVAFRETDKITDNRTIVFNTKITDDDLQPGKEYYVYFRPGNEETLDYIAKHPVDFFQMDSECRIRNEFKVKGSGIIKVEGEPQPNDPGAVHACAGSKPNIKIDIVGINADMEITQNDSISYDWFEGSLIDYYSATSPAGRSLYTILEDFRHFYPDAFVPEQPAIKDKSVAKEYTAADATYLRKLVDDMRLTLNLQSLDVSLPDEQGAQRTFVVVPIVRSESTDNTLYCFNPQEVTIKATGVAPIAHDGMIHQNYHISNIPLRTNVAQVRETSKAGGKFIHVPLLHLRATTTTVTRFDLRYDAATGTFDDRIYLKETNDPAYAHRYEHVDDDGTLHFLEVGKVTKMDADPHRSGGGDMGDDSANHVHIQFDDDFTPNEGFFYNLCIKFREYVGTGYEGTAACDGDIIIPVKIVPLYQKWTGGADNTDWNNDLNWARADKVSGGNDLLDDGVVYASYLTNEQNGTAFAYAPMEDTRIQMDEEAVAYPQLYDDGEISADTEHLALREGATMYIAEDMVVKPATSGLDAGNYSCVQYYTNRCREVHFEPGTEMLRADLLSYDKAWVEYRMAPARWYTLGSPLQDTYAGDMYMPTDGAQQLTPLYQPINYSTTLNDRFRPAVFQRGWDKGTANVYQMAGYDYADIINANPWNVAVGFDWSHVYNDVEVPYGGGAGFSIKTDVSNMAGEQPDSVVMRLPKADTQYTYYDFEGATDGRTSATLGKANAARLKTDLMTGDRTAKTYAVTITNDKSGKYFLVANPFMCGLHLDDFFAANPQLEKRLWLFTADGQTAALQYEPETWVTNFGSLTDIAPLQSFFVESKEESNTLSLTFTTGMMRALVADGDHTTVQLKAAHRQSSNAAPHSVCIKAEQNGHLVSAARLTIDSDGHDGYDGSEDLPLVLDSNLGDVASVFTLSDTQALSINRLRHATMVPICTYCRDDRFADDIVTLHFESENTSGNTLWLYDREADTLTPLCEVGELRLPARSRGRYYLTEGIGTTADDISSTTITLAGHDVVVDAGSSLLSQVRAVDAAGRTAYLATPMSTRDTFTLPAGVYVIQVKSEAGERTEKVVVRA